MISPGLVPPDVSTMVSFAGKWALAARTFSPRPIGGDPSGVPTADTEVGVTVGVAVMGGDSPSMDTGRL